MAECEHLTRTSMYFDGELPEAEQAEAVEHLATCAECQRVLGTAMSLDAAMSERAKDSAKPKAVDELAARRARRRWPLVAATVGVMAAAAVLLLWLLKSPTQKPAQVAIDLPPERAVAMRFTGDAFAKHRPYSVARSGAAHESISLATLAALEKRGDQRDLVAALASTGDLARAQDLAAKLPDDAQSESDRAALALAARDPETALLHAYRALAKDPALSAAWWNLALATRDLGLPRVAKGAFEHVISMHEPGWSDEAHTDLGEVEREIAAQDTSAIEGRAKEMLKGGPVLTAQDVADAPTTARFYFYDATRVATAKSDLERLRPLATALDAASGLTTATATLERVAATDFTVRAKVAAKYRSLVLREPGVDGSTLVEELRALGPAVADIYVGASVLTYQAHRQVADLLAITKPWNDPWLDLLLERERIRNAYPDNDLRQEPELAAAIATCTNPAFSLRCGQLSLALGTLLIATGRIEEGEARTRDAVDAFTRGRATAFLRNARTFLAEIHRRHGRFALAHAEFDEEIAAAKQSGACDLERYSEIGRANLAFMARETDDARAFLPVPKAPTGCSPGVDIIGLITAVDLARLTGDARDAAAAKAWVDEARASAPTEPSTIVAAARIEPADPIALTALRTWLAAAKPGYVNGELRVLGYSTLISEAGARKAWGKVIETARGEYRLTTQPPCVLVTSIDDDRWTVAAAIGGDVIGETSVVPAASPVTVPAAIVSKLATCTGIAVIGRMRSHGRADLLPAAYPWWFVGEGSLAKLAPTPGRTLQVIDVKPPELGQSLQPLPTLGPSSETFDTTLAGMDATPARVLSQLATASYVEIHAHGIVSGAEADATFLALSPDASGTFALDAKTIRSAKLPSAPFIVLGACRAAAVASVFRERWSLPDAFLVAGARGVVAADVEIPDAGARAVLDELHHRIAAGEEPAKALAAVRAARGGWAAHLMLFR